jgi:hypothetical protein
MQAQDDPTAQTQAASRAERVEKWLRVPLIVAALLAIPTIVVQETDVGGIWEILAAVLDWCIWTMFAANLAIMLSIVPDRRRWLINHPMDVLIVVLTPPFLPATMKLARVLPVVRLVWLMAIVQPLLARGVALRSADRLHRRGRGCDLRRRRAWTGPEHLGRALVGRRDRHERGLRGHLPNNGSRSPGRNRRNDRRHRLRRPADQRAGSTLPIWWERSP